MKPLRRKTGNAYRDQWRLEVQERVHPGSSWLKGQTDTDFASYTWHSHGHEDGDDANGGAQYETETVPEVQRGRVQTVIDE